MVKLTRIYTKGGDKGKTSLGTGKRVAKHHPRVAAYGTVDETNAVVGLARLHTAALADPEIDAILSRVQNDLFDLGADLATPPPEDGVENPEFPPLRIVADQVERLEREIDRLNAELQPLNSFVLPGGSPAAAYLHLARTIARRAEREITQLAESDAINPEAVRYINRLSDLFFVMSRSVNDRGAGDVLWEPGVTRAASGGTTTDIASGGKTTATASGGPTSGASGGKTGKKDGAERRRGGAAKQAAKRQKP